MTFHRHADEDLEAMKRERHLARIPVDFILHLMACGWGFDLESRVFTKGEHRIAEESLADFSVIWGGFLPFIKKAISKGAVGFTVTCRQTPKDSGVRAHMEYEWPDAVTRLGEVV